MKKPYVPYDLGLLLKQKGYNLSCIYHYKVGIADPKAHTNIPTFEVKTPFGTNHNQAPTRVSAPFWSDVIDWIFATRERIVIYSPAYSLERMIMEVETALIDR